jgi:hypothetical protein
VKRIYTSLFLTLSLTIGSAAAVGGPQRAPSAQEPYMAMPIVAPLFIENGQLSTTVTIINAMARGTKS